MNALISNPNTYKTPFWGLDEGECFVGLNDLGEQIIAMKIITTGSNCVNLMTGILDNVDNETRVTVCDVKIERK